MLDLEKSDLGYQVLNKNTKIQKWFVKLIRTLHGSQEENKHLEVIKRVECYFFHFSPVEKKIYVCFVLNETGTQQNNNMKTLTRHDKALNNRLMLWYKALSVYLSTLKYMNDRQY